MKEQVRVRKGLLGFYYISSFEDETKAWSGSQWVDHECGIPQNIQISNWRTYDEAKEYALKQEFDVIE